MTPKQFADLAVGDRVLSFALGTSGTEYTVVIRTRARVGVAMDRGHIQRGEPEITFGKAEARSWGVVL